IELPPGFVPTNVDFRFTPTLFERLLQEARTHYELAAAMASESSVAQEDAKRITTAQQQFFSCVRHAEYALAAVKSVADDFDAQRGHDRLTELKRQNAESAKRLRYDDQRK